MSFKEIINNLEPITYKDYFEDLSYETFMLYAALTLEAKWVPLTFSYLCIATYKLFPDMFYFDEEFKEFPAWERLNRTYMHLKYAPKGKPACISWTVETWYNFTDFWKQKAEIAKDMIDLGETKKKSWNIKNKKAGNSNKQGYSKYSESFLKSKWFRDYEETWKINPMWIYSFFDVAPFSQKSYIKQTLELWLNYAKEENNIRCIEFINRLLSSL